jgi:hypothetical protein
VAEKVYLWFRRSYRAGVGDKILLSVQLAKVIVSTL